MRRYAGRRPLWVGAAAAVRAAPVILLATGYELLSMFLSEATIDWLVLGVAAAVSAIVAYACIDLMMRFVGRIGLLPFAVYRLLLAGVIVYGALKVGVGIRLSPEEEHMGADLAIHKISANPEGDLTQR